MITAALQAIHFKRKQIYIAAIPAVADDKHDRAASQDAASPVKVKGLQRVTDARAARPIVDEQAHVFQSQVQVTDLKRTCDPREACAEDESFHRLAERGFHPINKMEQQSRIAFHRA